MTNGGRLSVCTLTVVVALLAPCAHAGGANDPAAPAADDDPVVRDVLRMLDQGVASSVIVAWLRQLDAPPRPLAADDVLRLHDAGASAGLLQELLERSKRTRGAVDESPAVTAILEGEARLTVRLRYSPFVDTEYGPEDDVHELFVYLDGELLGRVAPDSGLFSGSGVELRRRIAPGRRTVRLLRERHERIGRGDDARWTHESYVAPEILRLDIEPGHEWSLDVDWSESRFAFGRKGPLSWQLLREEERVAGADRTGTRAEDWPELCEDLEASLPPGEDPGKRIRRRLEGCVRWSGLWPGLDAFPTRAQVLDFLARFDYRPAPASQRP